MLRYIAKRVLAVIPVLLGISLITFLLIHFIPGDPVRIMLGKQAITEEVIERVRHELRLDQPLYLQYFSWLYYALQGNLGRSFQMNRPVLYLIADHFAVTLRLALSGLLVSMLIAMPLGIVSAVKKDSAIDYVSRVISTLGISLPPFFTGIVLILVFALYLRWFPSMGVSAELFSIDGLRTMALPSFALGFSSATMVARMVRATMVEVLEQDYIRTARSKGLKERVIIYRHALKNAMIPVTTVIGMTLGYLLGGSVIIETIFAWPGLGMLMVNAVMRRDYPLIQGIVLFFALMFTLTNLVIDLIYGFLDPRIRYR